MSNYIEVSQSVDVDVDVDLRDYEDEIFNFIKKNKDFQKKIGLEGFSKEKKIYKDYTAKDLEKSFCLSFDEALAHQNIKPIVDSRDCLTHHHLLTKDNKIEGIFTTDAHILLLTSISTEKTINDYLNDEFEIKHITSFSQQPPNPKQINLYLKNNKIFNHFKYNEEFSTENLHNTDKSIDLKILYKNFFKFNFKNLFENGNLLLKKAGSSSALGNYYKINNLYFQQRLIDSCLHLFNKEDVMFSTDTDTITIKDNRNLAKIIKIIKIR